MIAIFKMFKSTCNIALFAHSESYDTYIQKQLSLKVVALLCVAFNGWATVAFSAFTVKALHLATMSVVCSV